MDEAPDYTYLAAKVSLVFGISGAVRSGEIHNVLVNDVEDMDNCYLVSINDRLSNNLITFIIDDLYYQKVKEYIELRPSDFPDNRFFIKFSKGKCIPQALGKHNIEQIPSIIATYLGLENPTLYTGSCFRRTALMLLSESEVNMQTIKNISRI
ncbi:hypothetical protein TKK_0012808 [Trichogramma kaykai]